MSKVLSHVFTFLVNYYFLSFLLGTILVAFTTEHGPLPAAIPALVVLTAFLLVLTYQLTRNHWPFQSIGEQLLGSTSKASIVEQKQQFRVSRGLLFGMILLTLALNGNLQDGLTDQVVYSTPDLLILSLVGVVQYKAFRSFTVRPDMISIITLAGTLFMLGLLIQGGYRKLVSNDLAVLAGNYIYQVYKVLAILWLVVGFYYQRQYLSATE